MHMADGQIGGGPGPAAARTRGDAPRGSAAATFRKALLATLALIALCEALIPLISPESPYSQSLVFLTLLCAQHQDVPLAIATSAFLALLVLRPPMSEADPRPALRPALVFGGLALLVLGIWLIRIGVLLDHDFTRDEHMAVFDALIYGAGRVFWPLSPDMRPYYSALNDLFLFPIGNHEGLVSGYLPVNAGLRGLLGHVMPLSLVSPLLVGVSGWALWRIAVRLWPDEGATQAVVLVCFAASSQVILTGTAAFAMTTHLAFNLVWLVLFLRNTRASHAGALLVGLLATGIHQPIFHPLFVLPFLDLLRRQRRWPLLAFYLAGYLVIGLAWLAWPAWVASHGVGLPPEGPSEQFGIVARVLGMLAPPNLVVFGVMAANVLRFVTWQHLLLAPLAIVGVRRYAGHDDLARALLLGVLLTLLAMGILLPPQGHGWGYRYLHGLIGNVCLLAGYGWRWLSTRGGAPVQAMKLATAASVLIVLPLHTVMVRTMIAPYARAARAFAKIDADYVVVDSSTLPFGTNYVVNRPDLANRPRLLLGDKLNWRDLAALCPGRTIAFADAPQFAETYRYYIEPVPQQPSPLQTLQKRLAARRGCRVIAAPVE